MEPLKETYFSEQNLLEIGKDLQHVYPDLPIKKFNQAVTASLNDLELMQRLDQLVKACGEFLPNHFPTALNILYDYSQHLDECRFQYVFLSQYVAYYGLNYRRHSLAALADFTQYATSEFAVRYFLKQDLLSTLKIMRRWAESDNYHVRRLASEGARPKLPWSFHLTELINDPSPTLPILRTLNGDPEKYVQKSVANHLNDISKTHPDLVVNELSHWDHSDNSTRWIIERACRSLVKTSYSPALILLGIDPEVSFSISGFKLSTKEIAIGEKLQFSFELSATSHESQKLIVDYKIYYQKKSTEQKAKVFKLKSLTLAPGEKIHLKKSHDFSQRTTRTLYPGDHQISIVVNGSESKPIPFKLSEP
ncbi:MAG TPA: DNA alkylation repair protein [Gammaproteobacteria bacterium]|nr:DNA alkylation repair protein [Gammaproteobacteria bacterium]